MRWGYVPISCIIQLMNIQPESSFSREQRGKGSYFCHNIVFQELITKVKRGICHGSENVNEIKSETSAVGTSRVAAAETCFGRAALKTSRELCSFPCISGTPLRGQQLILACC